MKLSQMTVPRSEIYWVFVSSALVQLPRLCSCGSAVGLCGDGFRSKIQGDLGDIGVRWGGSGGPTLTLWRAISSVL